MSDHGPGETLLVRLLNSTRQRRYPTAFRIVPVSIPEPSPTTPQPHPDSPGPGEVGADISDLVLAKLLTDLWRARRKTDSPEARTDPSRTVSRASRHLGSAWQRLEEADIRVVDHDGLRFVVGMDIQVLAYDVQPGLSTETVIETVQPTVYRGERRIQEGQVIVGTPAPADPVPDVQPENASTTTRKEGER